MRHQRQAGLLRDFKRHVERRDPAVAAGAASDAHLDADNEVAIGLGDAATFAQVEQPDIGTFAEHDGGGESVDPCEGNVEIGEDADRRLLDDVVAETVEIARPGAARVDERGGGAARRQRSGIDAERGAAPVDMGVKIDETRRDDEAVDIAHFGTWTRLQPRADLLDAAILEGDVGGAVEVLAWIDDPAALEQ